MGFGSGAGYVPPTSSEICARRKHHRNLLPLQPQENRKYGKIFVQKVLAILVVSHSTKIIYQHPPGVVWGRSSIGM